MKRLIAVLLSLVLAVSLAACGPKVDLAAQIKPDDFSDLIMTEPEKLMKSCGIDEDDLTGGTLNPEGHNYLFQKVMLFGHIFDLDFEVYNNAVERITFNISKDDPSMEDKKLFIKLLDDMTELYGEPHTDKGDGRRYEYNQSYYLEDDTVVYEEWLYEGYDLQLICDTDPEGVTHTYIVMVVHVDSNETVE